MQSIRTVIAAALIQVFSLSPTKAGSIEGLVLGPKGEPIPAAIVQAMWVPPPLAVDIRTIPVATTDSDGRFRLDGLLPWGYRLSVIASGFIQQEYGASPGRGPAGTGELATILNVAAGENKDGIVVNLSRGGLVAGRISSTNGGPMVRMRVEILRRTFDMYGVASLITEATGETNDRGEYRIDGIAPGRYYVRASAVSRSMVESEVRRAMSSGATQPVLPTPGRYAPTFYPASSDYSKGLLVDVTSGGEVRNIDISLPALQTYTISGRVINPSGGPIPRLGPSLIPTPATTGENSLIYLPDGTFQWSDVARGVYWVNATLPRSLPAEQQQLLVTPGTSSSQLPPMGPHGAARVRIVDSDVVNVELNILPSPSLQGRVRLENVTMPLSEVKVQIHSIDSSGRTGSLLVAAVNEDGYFSADLPRAWEYRVSVSDMPSGLYLKEARLGSIDALVQTIDIIETPTNALEILLAEGALVEGVVRDGLSQPVPNQLVVLIPDVQNRADLYKTATTDTSGHFRIHGIAPGEYRIFAWKSLERFRYFDPDFVREFVERGVHVKAAESELTSVDVTVIP